MTVRNGCRICQRTVFVFVLSSTRSGIRTPSITLSVICTCFIRRFADYDVQAATVVIALLDIPCLELRCDALNVACGSCSNLLGRVMWLFRLLISVSSISSFAIVVDGKFIHLVGGRFYLVGNLQKYF